MQDNTSFTPPTPLNSDTSSQTQMFANVGSTSSDSISAQASGVADQGAEKAATLVGQVKEKAKTAVEGQKAGVADQLETLAGSVKKSGQQFRGQQDWIAEAIERGATELSTLATSLRESDLSEILGNVQTFARRQPALFIGATFAAGFALARFGKIVAADVSTDDLPTMPKVTHE